jgi:outer membrane protein OmpA-like peptidoglycan-associated protein
MRILLTCLLIAAGLLGTHAALRGAPPLGDVKQNRGKKKPTPTPTPTPAPNPPPNTFSAPARDRHTEDEIDDTKPGGAPDNVLNIVAARQKAKIKGVVIRRDADSFVVRDARGMLTIVKLTDGTSVKTKGRPFSFFGSDPARHGTDYGVTAILRGLNLEVEGTGDGTNLIASKIRFKEGDLRTARATEERRKFLGQLSELAAVSNPAHGEQQTTDPGSMSATNERISALDDYQVQNNTSILFRVGSAVLSPEGKTKLDQIAQQALQAKGYVLEVGGFASSDGSTEANRRLSQRRADTVIRYLVENHNIPLRRIITPYGYGEAQPVADNTTREGREQNRRVEVKVLVNRGLIQGAPTMTKPSSDNPGGN